MITVWASFENPIKTQSQNTDDSIERFPYFDYVDVMKI